MPDFSGFEVCKAFKSDKALTEVPIIFITSHESVQLEAKGIELGAADFISKPPHAPLVLARVRTYQRLNSLSDTMRNAVKMDFLTGAVTRRQLEKALTQEWLRVHHQLIDVVLMDVQMPVLDGNEAARRIRGALQLKHLPIVALTAGALVGERQRALDAGMNDFISKPLDPQAPMIRPPAA